MNELFVLLTCLITLLCSVFVCDEGILVPFNSIGDFFHSIQLKEKFLFSFLICFRVACHILLPT